MNQNQKEFSDLDLSFASYPKRITEVQFADLVGVSQSVVSRLLSRGALSRGADWRTWIKELHHHTAEMAAGRRGEGKLDLVHERARLAKAMADKTEFELRKARNDFISIDLTMDYVMRGYAIVKAQLLGLPTRVKAMASEMPISAVIKMTEQIRNTLTELGQTRMPDEIKERFKNWVERGDDSEVKKKPRREIYSRRMEVVFVQ